MKTVVLNIFTFIFLLAVVSVNAQDLIHIENSCSFEGEETNEDFYIFNAS